MASQNWDWVFIALGWTLAALGLLLALWALFYDRSRGRKRCPKCWYSMEGAEAAEDGAVTCPECGRRIASDQALHRTRRRLKRAVLGAFVCVVAYAVFVTPAVRRDGWVAVTPTTALVLLASPERIKGIAFSFVTPPTSPDRIERELVRRGEERLIYNWQADLLAWRLSRAQNDAPIESVFGSYDITTVLSSAWWSSPFSFTNDEKAELYWDFNDLILAVAIPDLWVDNGGEDASLFLMGDRIFVWMLESELDQFEKVLTLLITKGQGDLDRVSVQGWYQDKNRSHELRMYNVTDIVPPSVTRAEKQPRDPNTDTQWGHSQGELIFEYEAIWELIEDITSNVRMHEWVDNGGESATIRDVRGWLIICASPEMHDLVAERIELHRAGQVNKDGGPP